jgi:hypothetical protein
LDELVYLTNDWNLQNVSSFDNITMEKICRTIQMFDLDKETLTSHQIYIYQNRSVGLVKHYSLHGSYFMNKYLRKAPTVFITPYNKPFIRNLVLEYQITKFINLITNSPQFTSPYTLYRFVNEDSFLASLRVGSYFIESGFMSCTRDPFNYQENYQFGYILMKIKLPANVKGVALCIEAYSNFPSEEEIILPPMTRLRLTKIYSPTEMVLHDKTLLNKILIKKYEFEYIDNYFHTNPIEFKFGPEPKIPLIKYCNFDNYMDYFAEIDIINMNERADFFIKEFCNENHQFKISLNNINYIFQVEGYDSTTAYKDFFYYETGEGIMIYTSHPVYANLNIMLELGPELHVNYYFKYSVSDVSIYVDLDNEWWIKWIAQLAYFLGIRHVIFHPNYMLYHDAGATKEERVNKTRYTVIQNIYLYFKNQKKYYEAYHEIKPLFDYYDLDYLTNLKTLEVVLPGDELYQQYINNKEYDTIDKFYVFLVEKKPQFLKTLEDKLDHLYEISVNPFKNVRYTFDAWIYLYNNNFIKQMPNYENVKIVKKSFKSLIGDTKVKKFKNRIREYFDQKKGSVVSVDETTNDEGLKGQIVEPRGKKSKKSPTEPESRALRPAIRKYEKAKDEDKQ